MGALYAHCTMTSWLLCADLSRSECVLLSVRFFPWLRQKADADAARGARLEVYLSRGSSLHYYQPRPRTWLLCSSRV